MTVRPKPRLSIGLPVYNGANYLGQAIESLLRQTFTDFRLIISDNASTDGTAEICRSYERLDSRIEYHHVAENHGAAWNFNRVAQLADSEYFKWTTHDDLYAPEFIGRCIEVLDRQPRVVLCYTKAEIIGAHGELLHPYDKPLGATGARPSERFRDVLINLALCHMLLGVTRHAVVHQTQLYGGYPGSDAILLAELALRGEFREVDETLFFRRDHPQRPSRVHQSETALAVWFDPANAGRIQVLRWTFLANYLRTIARVPMPVGQRLLCTYAVARWSRWHRRMLGRDLALAVGTLLHRARRVAFARTREPGADARVA